MKIFPKSVIRAAFAVLFAALAYIIYVPAAVAASYPLVRNFPRAAYNAGPQNWAVAQSDQGMMLFGNSYGLLSYDSNRWTVLPNINGSTVRSIYVDNDHRRVYTGGSNDFGYFEPDARQGHLQYHSLRNTLPDSLMEFSEIWRIHPDGKRIWFQGDFHLFCYDGETTKVVPTRHKITASALIDGVLYLGGLDGCFDRIEDDRIVNIAPASVLAYARISDIIPYRGNTLWLCTPFNGIFSYEGGAVKPVKTDIDAFLRDNQLFCATASNGKIVFGTVNNGVVIKDLATDENSYANIDTGLQNNTVLSAGFDADGNLWLGLDNGLDYLQLSSPMTNLLGVRTMYGSGYASMLIDGRLYLGTNQGLYSMPFPAKASPSLPDLRQELQGQVWHLDTIGGNLLVSNDNGLYVRRRGGRFERVHGLPGSLSATPLRHQSRDGLVLVSTYEDFFLAEIDPRTGRMNTLGPVAGYDEAVGNIFEDTDGDVWLTHWLKGIYRLRLDPDNLCFTHVKLYNHGDGLPYDGGNLVSNLRDETVISTREGIYNFNEYNNTLKRYTYMDNQFGPLSTSRLYSSPRNDVWAVSTAGIVVASFGRNGEPTIDSVTYRPLADKLIPGYENFNFISPSQLIVASQDGFYDVDISSRGTEQLEPGRVHISAIYANQDSLVYNAPMFDAEIPELRLPYTLNSLKIQYISPVYSSQDAMRYSTRMQPFDGQWSPYTDATVKEYTDLPEGNYTFHVRALNRYTGQVTESAIRLSVLPPWYRSGVAYLVYVLLLLMVTNLGVRYFRVFSGRKAREVEQEKDYEIARLKSEQLEHDIKHKSGELSSITMNVIRKNEILLEISDRLTQLAESVERQTDPQRLTRQIEKIKTLIRENISHDDDWRTFTRNFDLVYENYLQRLLQAHPTLTQSDQRICAYIKMGLSSKEIAPLLNISYRSVEMSRYRIRKKMGLEGNVSLADYLAGF